MKNQKNMKKIRVLLVDDHQIIRDGIKLILDSAKDIEVMAEASNGTDAIQYLEKNSRNVDIVLMDINMPELNGIDTIEIITKLHKNLKILALTMHSEQTYILKMIRAGALGYVLKDAGGEKLIEAIKMVSLGKKYYSNEVSVTLINSIINGNVDNPSSKFDLTEREIDVLNNIVGGDTNFQIGDKLCISNRTVETHRRNIMKKLNAKNTAEMVHLAVKKGIVA